MKKRTLKKLFAVAMIFLMVFNMTAPAFAADGDGDDGLAAITLLRNLNMDGTKLGNVDGDGDYTLDLELTGSPVAEVNLLNQNRAAVFTAAELGNLWKTIPGEKATVNVEMLPLTLGDLGLDGLVDTVTGLVAPVTQLVSVVEAILDYPVLAAVLEVDLELAENLEDVLAMLDGLVGVLAELGNYSGEFDVNIVNGRVVVNFSEGLGDHVEELLTGVIETVEGTLNEVIDILSSVNINISLLDPLKGIPVVGDLIEVLEGVINGLLGEGQTVDAVLGIVSGLLDTLTPIVGQLTGDISGLLDILSLQVLGKTSVKVPVEVKKPSGLNQDVVIYGTVANDAAIELDILSDDWAQATVTFNETEDEGTPPADKDEDPVEEEDDNTLPKTSAGMLGFGLAGLGTLLAGVGTRLYARRKE